MKRRAFLGFLGGAAVAGPSVAKTAADMATTDLSLRNIGVSAISSGGFGSLAPADGSYSYDRKSWAKDTLKQLIGTSAAEKESKKQRFYSDGLDPQIASLRSVSLVNRIRISRDLQFARSEQRDRSYLEGIIAGLWS